MKIQESWSETVNNFTAIVIGELQNVFPNDNIIVRTFSGRFNLSCIVEKGILFNRYKMIYDIHQDCMTIECKYEQYDKVIRPLAEKYGFDVYMKKW